MYKSFNAKELEIIKENIDKITLIKLADLLGRSYSNLSGAMKSYRIFFRPINKIREIDLVNKNPIRVKKTGIEKKFNKGKEILTDDLAKSWFY